MTHGALHYFNPGHETALIHSSLHYTPPAHVALMTRELAYLPAWYAPAGSGVYVGDDVLSPYYAYLRRYFPRLPHPVARAELAAHATDCVTLWGISPQAVHFFSQLSQQEGLALAVPVWHEDYRYLAGRLAARDCLVRLLDALHELPLELVPLVCRTVDEVERHTLAADGQLLAKWPYSSSGRGLLWLTPGKLSDKEREGLGGIIRRQGMVCVERVWPKVMDFSMQFLCDGLGGVRFVGYSHFDTTERGAYTGHRLVPQDVLEAQLHAMIDSGLLEKVRRGIMDFLCEQCAAFYAGCVGVDMLIYRTTEGYGLHPCVEINLRYNMGYLAVMLQQEYLMPEVTGSFTLDFHAEPHATWKEHVRMTREHPLHVKCGRLVEGYLPLCPVDGQTRYRAYMLV